MIAEAGHYALVLALALALIQSTVPMLGARWHDIALMNVARSTALAQLLFVAVSFAALVTLHVTSSVFRFNSGLFSVNLDGCVIGTRHTLVLAASKPLACQALSGEAEDSLSWCPSEQRGLGGCGSRPTWQSWFHSGSNAGRRWTT